MLDLKRDINGCSICLVSFNDGDITVVTFYLERKVTICHSVFPTLFEKLCIDESYDCSRAVMYPKGMLDVRAANQSIYGIFYKGDIYSSLEISQEIDRRDYLSFIPNTHKGVRINDDLEFLTDYEPFLRGRREFFTMEQVLEQLGE